MFRESLPSKLSILLASLPARVGLLVHRHQSHEAYPSTFWLLVYQLAIVAKVLGHLADTEERRFQELLVDLTHKAKVRLDLAFGYVMDRRARNRQRLALLKIGRLQIVAYVSV